MLFQKEINSLRDVAACGKKYHHKISLFSYLFDALFSRFLTFISVFGAKKTDPVFFADINGSRLAEDFEKSNKFLDRANFFWRTIGRNQLAYCTEKRFQNFKSTLNRRFFWLPCNNNRDYLKYYFEKVTKADLFGLLDTVEDPPVGNPVQVAIGNGRAVSQDILRSLDEFYCIFPYLKDKDSWKIAEIGAGYGRLAYVFLKAAEHLKIRRIEYFIFDIPPTLLISSKYFRLIDSFLKNTELQFYRSRPSILNQTEGSQKSVMRFCLPGQIEDVPQNYFNAVINISSFEEMDQETVNAYFDVIDKKLMKGGIFFTKQWGNHANDLSKYAPGGIERYPYKPHWKEKFCRRSEPPFYFEAVFENQKDLKQEW